VNLLSELRRRNVLRVAVAYAAVAWLFIQIAETLFGVFGFGDTPARVVVIVLAIGFVPSLVFTWIFELTPDGFRKEKDIDHAHPATGRTGKKLDLAIMGVLALAVAYFAFDKFILEPMRQEEVQRQVAEQLQLARQEGRAEAVVAAYGNKSIAVLAFQDMSQNGDQEYLADGLAEELLNLLAKFPELRVISRSSAFSYKGKDMKLDQIARELNVAHVLEGSVRKSGNRVRITAQLIDARSDTHLWSETYDRNLDDIFAIQDEIAGAVVEQLKVTLLDGKNAVRTSNTEAFALLLEARHLARQGTAEAYEESISLYQRALDLSPDYVAAWAGLATNYSNQANKSLRPYDEGYALARKAAEHALAIDPDYPPALTLVGWIAMIYDNDLRAAANYLERALALDPTNLSIIGNAASLLYTLGRREASIKLDEYVTAHDPLSPTGHSNLAEGYLSIGQWDSAIASYRAALRLSPDRIAAHYFIGVAELFRGDYAAALDSMQQEPFEILRALGLAMAYHSLGEADLSDSVLAQLMADYEHDAAYNIAYVCAWRGETDPAFEWLAKAVDYGDPGLSDIVGEPLFISLHGDPRWLPFLESIGKSPAQLDAIPFEVTLPGSIDS